MLQTDGRRDNMNHYKQSFVCLGGGYNKQSLGGGGGV